MSIKILLTVGLMLFISSFPLSAQNVGSLPQEFYNRITYIPDKHTKPAIVYSDMDGDKKKEMVVTMQMLPVHGGWFQTFAFVYRTDGKGRPKTLLKTIHLGDLLGTKTGNDDQEKVINVVDLNNDGKKAVALWSTIGMHYSKLIIIGMKNGRVIQLFNGGSDDEVIYEPRKNKNIITAGDRDWYPPYNNTDRWRKDVWEWNGVKFVYSKKKSSVTVLKNEVSQ